MPSPGPEILYQWVLELMEALDDEVIVTALAALFPKSPAVADALRARTAAQFKVLALHILGSIQQEELRQKAVSLLNKSRLIEEPGR
jgi:hypothetical protein